MKLAATARAIYDAISEFEIIDSHEHLPPEKVRVAQKQDVFTLFSQYARMNLFAAGMKLETYDWLKDPDQPLDARWKTFEPFLPAIRHASQTRPSFITAREIYGAEDINSNNYRELSERIQAENTAGIYQRILGDKCRIKRALTVTPGDYKDDPLLLPVRVILYDLMLERIQSWDEIEAFAARYGRKIKTLDDYVDFARGVLLQCKEAEGTVGIKIRAWPFSNPGKASAESAFAHFAQGRINKQRKDILSHYMAERCAEIAGELRLVVAVHCGMSTPAFGPMIDFRNLDAQQMIPFIQRHPDVRFDLYHLSIPNIRPCLVIAKNFPNVSLDLTWAHIISSRMTCLAMDECLDIVPVNKIIAFGGDYSRPVEKVYGHLVVARENVAMVLGRRVDEDRLSMDEATQIAHQWFYENPKRIYGLNV